MSGLYVNCLSTLLGNGDWDDGYQRHYSRHGGLKRSMQYHSTPPVICCPEVWERLGWGILGVDHDCAQHPVGTINGCFTGPCQCLDSGCLSEAPPDASEQVLR